MGTAVTSSTAHDGSALDAGTLCEAFQRSVARCPERVALRTPGGTVQITWAEYGAAVRAAAGALGALGVGSGDRVAFLSRNRPELAICEVATMHLGAAGVALYTASPTATIEHVLADSEPAVLLVESEMHARVVDVRHRVAHVLALDAGEGELRPLNSLAPPATFDFDAAWRAVRPDDLAGLLYTSGTTGFPKAVEWTHAAEIGWLKAWNQVLGETDQSHDISYGAFAHGGERAVGHWYALERGSTRTLCADPAQLGAALLEARPTFLFGSPQVWQRLKRALQSTLDAEERATLHAGVERVRALAQGQSAEPLTAEQQQILATLRARIGLDRMNCALTAAAPCPLAVHEHYHALGVPFREFYGMTELGTATVTRPGLIDLDTVGCAVPGYELRLAEDSEVMVRSPHAPRRYHNRPRESAETYGAGGWIHTGDIGELDAEGRLRIVDRKKEIIIPEHGHNVAPARIESALKNACPEIAQVCVVGHGRPHLAALVVLDQATRLDEQASAAVAAAIAEVNATFEPRERIEAHTILADVWLPGAELTETLKLRRAQIAERHASTIERLYSQETVSIGSDG